MSCIVADAGLLIALAKLGLLDLPARAFGETFVQQAVYSECLAQAPDAKIIRCAAESGVLVVRDDTQWLAGAVVPRLDLGELATLSLARELIAPVLMDERRGRRAARRLGIPAVGVCGLLLIAKHQGWIPDVQDPLAALKQAGYFISHELQRQTLKLAGEAE